MRNNVHALSQEIIDWQCDHEGKTEEQAKAFLADYLVSFLAQMYETEHSVRKSVDARLSYQSTFLSRRVRETG